MAKEYTDSKRFKELAKEYNKDMDKKFPVKRKYTKSGKPKNKRESQGKHHDNLVPKREDVAGYSFVNSFVFSDKLEDWKSNRNSPNLF